jgi:tetratricopeptide (TPR) repeat protein
MSEPSGDGLSARDAHGQADTIITSFDAAVLSKRIDDLVARESANRIWYRDGSLIVAICALFISVLTTGISIYHTRQQDVTALSNQLRSAIQQAGNLSVQNAGYLVQYKDDPQSLLAISSALNSENITLAREAYGLTKALGSAATSIDLIGAASALINSQDNLLAEELLKQAVDRASTSIEYVASLRYLAAVEYQEGKHGEASADFNKALNAFSVFPGDGNNDTYVALTQSYTLLGWAGIVGADDCTTTRQNLEKATQELSKLPDTLPQKSVMTAQAQKINARLGACK